jgi:hypothetical protein
VDGSEWLTHRLRVKILYFQVLVPATLGIPALAMVGDRGDQIELRRS